MKFENTYQFKYREELSRKETTKTRKKVSPKIIKLLKNYRQRNQNQKQNEYTQRTGD